MTDKLYYKDSHIMNFAAEIISCESYKNGYAVVLDRTAFFPEGGGQSADIGYINGVRVNDVQEIDGRILHFTDSPVAAGGCRCSLDAELRLRRMQNHSGEHIVSGLINSLKGYDNVGFHMGDGIMTIDFSGELTREELMTIEKRANEVVRDNIEIIQHFPSDDELKDLTYRSKLALTHDVRIVEIPGVDICACCAPHVQRTGEVGFIKILSSERHRGGTRITMCCGMNALDAVNIMQENITAISSLLSAKREETASAVERLLQERDAIKFSLVGAETRLISAIAKSTPDTSGNICLFEGFESSNTAIELINLLAPKCTGMAGVFSGSDEKGYKYIIGSTSIDLRAEAKNINSALNGRGGGKPQMIMGSASASAEEIKKYFAK